MLRSLYIITNLPALLVHSLLLKLIIVCSFHCFQFLQKPEAIFSFYNKQKTYMPKTVKTRVG